MKYVKIVIKYVLRSIEDVDIKDMKLTLNILLRLIDKLPDYYADDVLEALIGGEEDAE